MDEKRRMGIEELLRWAYRDELPKAGATAWMLSTQARRGWEPVEHYGETLSIIDGGENVWGLAPDLTANRLPHPDAERVGRAVEGLDDLVMDLPEGWNPLDDIVTAENAGLVAEAVAQAARLGTVTREDGRCELRAGARFLVVRHALAASAPDWSIEVPSVQVVSANGKARWFRRVTLKGADGALYEQEVDGRDRTRHRPYAGAYRKLYLDPDPTDGAVWRLEYETWRAALDAVVDTIEAAGGLAGFEVLRSERAVRPWMDGVHEARRVLPDLKPVHNFDYAGVTVGAYYRKRVAGRLTRASRLA